MAQYRIKFFSLLVPIYLQGLLKSNVESPSLTAIEFIAQSIFLIF